MADFVSFS